MSLFSKYLELKESSTNYDSGVGYSARVVSKNGSHNVKFFRKGTYLQDADYQGSSEKDAHDFAEGEMKHRKTQYSKKNEDVLDERILEPQGHLESPDKISDDSNRGKGPIKKMMGNKTPLDIISKILAKR